MRWGLTIVLLAGCSNAPLRFHLSAPSNDDCIIHYRMLAAGGNYDLTLKLHYRVLQTNEVEIGPGAFPDDPHGPKWPAGATARFHFSELGHPDGWTLSTPPELSADEVAQWKNALERRYSFGVGIVEFPADAAASRWERREHQDNLGVSTHYQRWWQSRDKVKVRIDQTTTPDGQEAPVERITGEVIYDLKRPLPIGGWLEIGRSDPNGPKMRFEFGN